jgi:hypothetical protein
VTSPEQCSGCHSTLNPPGFAFENYDAMGRWRSEDNGQPVDASGTVRIGDEDFQFDDGVELAHQLAASATVRDCYVLRWARYATGSHLAASQPGLEGLREGFRQDDDVIELLVAIVKSDLFRYRGVEGEGGHDADGEER